MLSQKNRISKKAFPKILREGYSVHSPFFRMVYVQNTEDFNTRIAVIVSKKVAKQAVQRNLIRRRIYSAQRNFLQSIKKPYLIAFFVKKEAFDASFIELQTEIEQSLKKARIL